MLHPDEDLPFIAQRLFNAPLALHPAKAEIVMAALAQRIGVATLTRIDGSNRAFADEAMDDPGEPACQMPEGYDLIGGIAIIYVHGTLVQRRSSLRPYSGMTGYNAIRQNLDHALMNSAARGIMFDVDSPGGECAGCFDLADYIFEARKEKPIWAMCSERAFSAGYAIASSASKLILPQTGGVGSIGIIAMHTDFSQALDKNGIAVTLIQYGDRKADFAETAPLSREARTRVQADVDTMGAIFDETAARNRGLTASKIKSYQAGTFLGAQGVEAGLADAVMPPDRAIRAFAASLN
jgi:signal peptide peptidase SppA